MRIEPISGDFTVCKVTDGAAIHLAADYCFVGKTDEELSLICRTEDAPESTLDREDGWRMFRVKEEMNFAMVGVLSGISALLAGAGVVILAVSTFNTDYILVKKAQERMALDTLAAAGHEIL